MGSSKGGSTFDVVATSGFLCVNLLALADTRRRRIIVSLFVSTWASRSTESSVSFSWAAGWNQ